MTLEEQIKRKAKAAKEAAEKAAKLQLREAMLEADVFIFEFMQPATATNYTIGKASTKTKKAVNEIRRAKRNSTDKLYTLYGNLRRALTPRGVGHIERVTDENGVYMAEIGIDTDTEVSLPGGGTTSLVYAAVHENSRRAYLKPGLEAYAKSGGATSAAALAQILEASAIAWELA